MKSGSLIKSTLLAVLFAIGMLAASALAQQSGGAVSGGAMLIPNYTPVTQQRLDNPKPQNWLIYKGSYKEQTYSPLDQINTNNVSNLVPVWSFSTGETHGHEGAPLVNNGIMFATGAYDTLFALNAKTGKLIWSYKRNLPQDVYPEVCCDVNNRGVALYGNDVYMATLDSHLLAFDARTGKMVWDTTVANYKAGYTMTLAPLAVKGKIIVGVAGGEYGIRGFVAAYDAKTGKLDWKAYTTAAPNQAGGDTWPGDTYKHGASSVWVTGSYDPNTNLTYWGTGNGGPWMGQVRPGDNLYLASVVGIDVDTGQIKAYYQYVPNESWDYDEVSDQTLVTVKRNGKEIKGIIHAGRDGYFYLLNRGDTIPMTVAPAASIGDPSDTGGNDAIPTSGGAMSGGAASGGAVSSGAASGGAVVPNRFKFVYGIPYIKSTPRTITGFTKDGRPIIPDNHKPAINKQVTVCPGTQGGVNWEGLSYNPNTGYAYIPTTEFCKTETGTQVVYTPGQNFIGASNQSLLSKAKDLNGEYGALQAINVATGKVAWRTNQKLPLRSPTMTTKGNLVFVGDVASRQFRAYNAKTGKELWRFTTNSGVVGVPTTFEVDGVQYVAVESGVGGNASHDVGTVAKLANVPYTQPPQGGVIWVFALNNQQGTGAQSGGAVSGGAASGGAMSGGQSGGAQ
jgi:alcohol dehydrogenase (cytochrome c)